MYKITLKNIKSINYLEFSFPDKNGVYLLTGGNGCGKTTLLIALNRLGDNLAFSKNIKTSTAGFDSFRDAQIIYSTEHDSVIYHRAGIRWVPTPRSKSNLIKTFPCQNILYLSTSGLRFYAQEPKDLKDQRHNAVSDEIINPLNDILNTSKFNDLKYIKIKSPKGKQRHLHRDNKLYVIKDPKNNYYSEQNFSLGERLLLNSLDFIEKIKERSLLLIDEVELALHPIAQIKFYDYLTKIAKEKKLTVILSTHSSSLIKHAKHRIYLENNNGQVSVLNNCYPAYILRDIATEEDFRPDFIFLVEDIMAQRYMHYLLSKYLKEINSKIICKIIPVGGHKQVIELMEKYPTLSYPKSKIQSMLDADVKDTYKEVSKKSDKTDADAAYIDLFRRNKNNISFLKITPELRTWEWLLRNPNILQQNIESKYGRQSFYVSTIVQKIEEEEAINKNSNNLRNWAKGCFKNLASKVCPQIKDFNEADLYKCIFESYVEDFTSNQTNMNYIKGYFGRILNRK